MISKKYKFVFGHKRWSKLIREGKDNLKFRTNKTGVFIFDNTMVEKEVEGKEDDGADEYEISYNQPDKLRGTLFGRAVTFLLNPKRTAPIESAVYPNEIPVKFPIETDNGEDAILSLGTASIVRKEDGQFSHYDIMGGKQVLQNMRRFSLEHGFDLDSPTSISSS